jgi:hypothetical protein
MQRSLPVLAAAALCGVLSAQTGRKATTVGPTIDLVLLGPTSGFFPADVTEILQYEARPKPTAGLFQLTCTVQRPAGRVIMTGEMNTNTNPWSFTEDTVALQNVVSLGGFAGTMTPDLLVLAYDAGTGPVKYSVRTATNVAFPTPKDLTGISGFVDSKLYSRDGKDYFAYVSGLDIRAVEIDRTKFATGTDPKVGASFVLVPFPGHALHSQEVMLDNGRNGRAVIHSANNGGAGTSARPWYTPNVLGGIDNTEVSKQFDPGPNDNTWLANPMQLGGSTIYAQAAPSLPYGAPRQVRIVASCGGAVPSATGGVLNLSAWLPYRDAANFAVTVLIGVPSADITVPGFRGKLALQLGFFALPPKLWGANDLSADWIVNVPPLAPGVLWSQTLAFDGLARFDGDGDGNGDAWYFGNTGKVEILP